MAVLIGSPERVTAPVLTTAKILFWMPDHPLILNFFVWQDIDLLPEFPKLGKFLDFWQANLDGKVFAVEVVHSMNSRPAQYVPIDGVFKLN